MIRSALILVATLLYTLHSNAQQPPNIVLLFVDDLNVVGEAMGGDPQVHTPNLQRLANQGVHFTNGYANSTVCSPSRASMLHGLYPHNSGYYGHDMGNNSFFLNESYIASDNVFEHFKNDGTYDVIGMGKLFHGNQQQFSFDTYFRPQPNSDPAAWDGVTVNNNGNPVPMTHPLMPVEYPNRSEIIAPLSAVPTIGDYTGWIYRDGTPFMYENDSVRDLLRDEKIVVFGTERIMNQPEDQPFFISFGLHKPHTPFIVPDEFFDLYDFNTLDLPMALESDLEDVGVGFMNNRWNSEGNYNDYRLLLEASADSSDSFYWLRKYVHGYYASVSFLDAMVGQILDSLEASPHADNTYVFLVSDHGFHLGEKTLIKKTTLWERSAHIPFLASGPGIPQGAVCHKPVSLIDIYPTFVEIAGIAPPAHALDGFSLIPLLENPEEGIWDGPPVAVSHVGSDELFDIGEAANPTHQHHAVSSPEMRYLLYATGEEELYDVVNDPHEWVNLAHDPAYAIPKAWLRNQLVEITGIEEHLVTSIPESRIFHGGFEQGLNGWAERRTQHWDSEIREDGEQTEGARYIRINCTNNGRIENSNLLLRKDETYVLSFDGRVVSGEGLFTMELFRTEGDDEVEVQAISFFLDEDWNTFTTTFTYPDTTVFYDNTLRFIFGGNVTFDLDNFRLFGESESNCSENPFFLVMNQGFEEESFQWVLHDTQDGSLVASSTAKPYFFQPWHVSTFCLPDGCYSLSFEGAAPGINLDGELAWWMVVDEAGQALAEGSHLDEVIFCLGGAEYDPCPPLPFDGAGYSQFRLSLTFDGYQIIEDGSVIELTDIGVKIPIDYQVTASSILSFDYRSTAQTDVHAVSVVSAQASAFSNMFKLHGNLFPPTLNLDFDNYAGNDWVHFEIPLGEYTAGLDAEEIRLLAGNRLGGPSGNGFFKDIRLYEDGQCDIDESAGLVTVQEPEEMALSIADFDVLIYPNPLIDGALNYAWKGNLPHTDQTVRLSVWTYDGRVVHESTLPAQTRQGQIALPSLGAGLYFLKFTEGHTERVKRLVKY